MTGTAALTTIFSSVTGVISGVGTPVLVVLSGIALLSLVFKIKS